MKENKLYYLLVKIDGKWVNKGKAYGVENAINGMSKLIDEGCNDVRLLDYGWYAIERAFSVRYRRHFKLPGIKTTVEFTNY